MNVSFDVSFETLLRARVITLLEGYVLVLVHVCWVLDTRLV